MRPSFQVILLGLLLSFLFISCGDSGRQSPVKEALTVASKVSNNTMTVCFLRTDGRNWQDTAAVRLVINNKTVSGKMINMPFQKDWRKGTLKGTRNGDTVDAMWTYMQEGMWDSLKVSFVIKNDQLIEKATAFDPAKG